MRKHDYLEPVPWWAGMYVTGPFPEMPAYWLPLPVYWLACAWRDVRIKYLRWRAF
jgi:hypothetical protein